MAKRPVFIVVDNESKNTFVDILYVDFNWYPGFSISQKQKCIDSLHKNFLKLYREKRVLEVSTKSNNELGKKLSAFNLKLFDNTLKKEIPVENIFQASKVFENGKGPYSDLLEKTPYEAKKDPRLRNSGEIIYFLYDGIKWPTEPKTLFYNWIYINALYANKELAEKVTMFDAFTDIEFNPKKSYNCQAYAVALYVSLYRRGLLEKAITSHEEFKNLIINKFLSQGRETPIKNINITVSQQLGLFDD